jgi:hypothetical protein
MDKLFTHHQQAVFFCFIIFACVGCQFDKNNKIYPGSYVEIGNGIIESIAEVDDEGILTTLGIIFHKGSLENLPTAVTDGHRCGDFNADGTIDPETECLKWHERVIPFPSDISRRSDIPFKWVLVNYNPHGHMPEGVWNTAHFDVHFYLDPIEKVFSIMPGNCGPEYVRCDQFMVATKPVPSNYIHKDFQNVNAVAPAMGNHLIDPTGMEFHGKPFTRSWIYGTYDGRITFWEEMLSVEFLKSRPDNCFSIKLPEAVAVSGYYPTNVCTRYNKVDESVSVSIEDFVYWQAKPAVAALSGIPN